MSRRPKVARPAQRPKKERPILYGRALARMRDEADAGIVPNLYMDSTVATLGREALEAHHGPLPDPGDPRAPMPFDWLEIVTQASLRERLPIERIAYGQGPVAHYAQNAAYLQAFLPTYRALVRHAQVYVARGAQLDQFRGVTAPAQPLTLPFPYLWVEFDQPRDLFPQGAGLSVRKPATGVLVALRDLDGGGQVLTTILMNDDQFAVSVHAARAGLTFAQVTRLDPAHAHERDAEGINDPCVRQMHEELFNYLYLLQADNVRVERRPPAPHRFVRRDGRVTSLPESHHLLFTDLPRSAAGDRPHGAGSTHTVRYDVAGHWRTYTKGRDEPRRVWIHPHQRGLDNDVYRPRNRALRAEPEAAE